MREVRRTDKSPEDDAEVVYVSRIDVKRSRVCDGVKTSAAKKHVG